LRRICDREGANCGSAQIVLDGVEYINFSSNDYLGLASSPVLADAAREALALYPFGAGASRLLSGGTSAHRELEEKIAAFKGAEAALLLNSGYHANVGVISALASEGDSIFSDELNHASIIDGCRLSRAGRTIYRHRDMDHLLSLLREDNGRRKLIVTDTVFSMDGDLAPLDELCRICSQTDGALLYLDDAHGTGVLGKGRGAMAHFNIRPEPWIIQMGTLSKALGSFGAFIAGSRDMVAWLTNTARGLIYSTALPACVAAAAAASIDILSKDGSLPEKLWRNQRRAVSGIRRAGYRMVSEDSPIIALLTGDIEATLDFAQRLRKKGIYAPAIRPPTVREPRIRLTVSAAHNYEDIDFLVQTLNEIKIKDG
jgi:8-amino-7-oxononanoate synthase